MRYSETHKAESRKRIIDSASRQFRSAGKDAASVPAIMQQAGLTHGAFYAHFDSKDALFAEAIGAALDETRELLLKAAKGSRNHPAKALISAYLTDKHREGPESGCVFAALGPEIARSDEAARAVATRRHQLLVEAIAGLLDAGTPRARRATATAMVSAMVGAIVLSRLTNDERYASEVIGETRRFLLSAVEGKDRKE